LEPAAEFRSARRGAVSSNAGPPQTTPQHNTPTHPTHLAHTRTSQVHLEITRLSSHTHRGGAADRGTTAAGSVARRLRLHLTHTSILRNVLLAPAHVGTQEVSARFRLLSCLKPLALEPKPPPCRSAGRERPLWRPTRRVKKGSGSSDVLPHGPIIVERDMRPRDGPLAGRTVSRARALRWPKWRCVPLSPPRRPTCTPTQSCLSQQRGSQCLGAGRPSRA
jgi:hypothetical protein